MRCCLMSLLFFFFFKQKTAYEMRISDWSSDVCSSDLRENHRVVSRFSLGTVFPIDIVAIEPLGRFWDRYFPTVAITAGFGLALTLAWILKIGRASCRERVCQYV